MEIRVNPEYKTLNVVGAYPQVTRWQWLQDVFGEDAELTKFIRMFNLLGFVPDKSYPLRAAAIASAYLKLEGPTLLVGSQVAAAFGLARAKFFTSTQRKEAELFVIPEFSQTNLWWRNADNTEEALYFFAGLLDDLRSP